MHQIFHISSKQIQQLNDLQARELIARLCKAELRLQSISETAVTWGGDHRAKDGGVDVRVAIEPSKKVNGFIKNCQCAFQVKAEKEKYTKSKIEKEMAPKGVLRPSIIELAEKKGAYIIASTKDDLSDSSLKTRIKEMSDCLTVHNLKDKVELDFYDSRKIADWVESHPTIVNWVLDNIGEPLSGWKPYGPWAYGETDVNTEYLIDERVKIFLPNDNDGKDVLSAIQSLRLDLSKKTVVRLVGLSGMGKTRLIQAIFDDRIKTEVSCLNSENVIYTDLSDTPIPQPKAMLEELILIGSDAVIIIDNCGQKVHGDLTEIAKRKDSKLRLITVEYDIRDDLPEGTVCYRLEGSSNELIKELLKRRFEILSHSDLDKITEFSDGNSRVAFALASSTHQQGELARLQDEQLFKRLFVQQNEENDELLKCAEVASLLYSFNGEDTSETSEMAILSYLADVTILTFSRNITELQRRGLMQQRGVWRAMLPHAISNRLAIRSLESIPNNILIQTLVEKAPDRVARSFARRLGFLHEYHRAKELAEEWLNPGKRLGNLTQLSEIERDMFINIAPLDQQISLEAINRATQDPDFVSIDNFNRKDFARVVRSLTYDDDLFDRAVDILLRFTSLETDEKYYISTSNLLESLFYLHLSGTNASPEKRSTVIKQLLFSKDKIYEELGCTLLSAAFETDHFSSSQSFDFGARKRGFGWQPQNVGDVKAWYNLFINIAVEIGLEETDLGSKVQTILGQSLRGLWVYGGIEDEIVSVCEKFKAVDGWPEAWISLKNILNWDKDKISETSLTKLKELVKFMAPEDLKEQIITRLLTSESFEAKINGEETGSSRYKKARRNAEDLGRMVAQEKDLLTSILPKLFFSKKNQYARNLGIGVGQEIEKPAQLIKEIRKLIENNSDNDFNFMFCRGLISAWNEKRPVEVSLFLDEAVDDEVWKKHFPELQLTTMDLDEAGYQRIKQSLELGETPSWQYSYLSMGRVTDPLSINQISNLIKLISNLPDGGLSVSTDLLAMVINCSKEKTNEYREDLKTLCLNLLHDLNWAELKLNNGVNRDMEEVLSFSLSSSKSENKISAILDNLISQESSDSRSYSRELSKLLSPFFKYHPKLTLDAVYVPDEDGRYQRALQMIGNSDSDFKETAISEIPEDEFINWCDISPDDRYLFAAQTCKLFSKTQSDSSEIVSLTEIAKRVVENSKDKEKVLNIIVKRFRPTGWSGSLAVILKSRLPLLKQLNPSNNECLRKQIASAEEYLKEIIINEEKREKDWEKERTGRFE